MPPPKPAILSFVSGKGGVGKTLLSSNFAWVCSHFARTLIIDLDFQNQGCTGLFLSLLPHETHGVLHYLRGPDVEVKPAEIAKQLWFLPASSVNDLAPTTGNAVDFLHNVEILELLRAFLARICALERYDVIVLDCHGGLDYSSVAAYSLSDHTILVGEANTVAFNGTLELLSFYDLSSRRPEPGSPSGDSSLAPPGPIHFVINRLAPKFTYDDIQRVYDGLLAGYQGPLNLDRHVLSFVPDESFVAESFGDYAFLIQLAPWSVTAKKIYVLVLTLLPFDRARFAVFKPLRSLKSPKARRKIQRRLISSESASVKMVMYAYGWSTVLVFLLVIAELVGIAIAPGDPSRAFDAFLRSSLIVTFLAAAGILCLVYLVRAQIGVMRYYREVLKFRKALVRVKAVRGGPWQFFSLMRLRVMWLCCAMVVYGIYSIGAIYLLIGMYFGTYYLFEGKWPS